MYKRQCWALASSISACPKLLDFVRTSELSSKDIEKANIVFSIYDFTGNNTIDAVNLGDCLRSLNLNPTLALVEKLGGTKKKGKRLGIL